MCLREVTILSNNNPFWSRERASRARLPSAARFHLADFYHPACDTIRVCVSRDGVKRLARARESSRELACLCTRARKKGTRVKRERGRQTERLTKRKGRVKCVSTDTRHSSVRRRLCSCLRPARIACVFLLTRLLLLLLVLCIVLQ